MATPSLDPTLLEEYKLIQAKIDKLGEDKFRVRSWCFTLLTGAFAGAKLSGALDDFWAACFLLLLFLPVIFAFNLVELRQRQIANRFGTRAHAIERLLKQHLIKVGALSTLAPSLAGHMIRQGVAERARCSFWRWCSRKLGAPGPAAPRIGTRAGNRAKPASLIECLTANADEAFYWMQYVLVIVSIVTLVVCRLFSAPAPRQTNSDLAFQMGTNEFRIHFGRTNITVTNFVEIVRFTTNFQIVNQPTTNFVPTTIQGGKPLAPGENK